MDIERAKVVGKTLRSIRTERGLKQTELAEKLSRPQSYISKIETGERSLPLVEVFDFAHALDEPVFTLVERFELDLKNMN